MLDKLIVKEVPLKKCIAYEGGYTGKKAEWRRTKSAMYPHVKGSLIKYGMINPLWVFENNDGTYRIAKGCCRAVACWDLGIKIVKVLIAPLGMERRVANRLFREYGYKDAYYVDEKGDVVIQDGKPKVIPKGF